MPRKDPQTVSPPTRGGGDSGHPADWIREDAPPACPALAGDACQCIERWENEGGAP